MRGWWVQLLENTVEVAKISALVAVPAGLLATHVWHQYRITKLGYKISEETKRHEELEDRHRKLTIEATIESHSDRLSEMGRERFGLEPVRPDQILAVEVDGEQEDSEESSDDAPVAETEHARLERRGATP